MSHTRRDFLRATLGASACACLGPTVFSVSCSAGSQPGACDTVLVVIQLTGGNDGLNTVVPYGDDEYGRNRKTLRLPTPELHKIDSLLAFHPRMEAFQRLYDQGCLSIVQGVGYEKSDRDHDRAMRDWHTADPGHPRCQTGWLGRAADHLRNAAEMNAGAVFVGPIARPFALNAESAIVPSLRSPQDLILRGEQAGQSFPDSDSPLLQFLRQSTLEARIRSERLRSVVESTAGAGDYPPFGLARDLRTIAQLIRADLGMRVFLAELGGGGIGGFDNHANQLGNHCAVLHQLAESVAAFMKDLRRDKTLDRVLLMTFSEFGRTVRENGRRGTDHGAAAPLFLAGGKVKGGLVGQHPSLTDLDQGALKVHIDFHRVYATVLDQWLGIDSRTILGDRFEPLDVLQT